jgi:uridine kinase
MKPYFIGVAGPSCSGKSCVAAHLAARLSGTVLSLDSYYRPLDHLTLQQRIAHNFDVPAALDSDLLFEHLRQLQQGCSVQCPVDDLTAQTRTAETVELVPQPFLIVEGLFALYWDELRASLGTKVYIDLDEGICLERRIARDICERGRTRESVLLQYRSTVAPMARQYVFPARLHANLLIGGDAVGMGTPGASEFSRQLDVIVQHARRGEQLRRAL